MNRTETLEWMKKQNKEFYAYGSSNLNLLFTSQETFADFQSMDDEQFGSALVGNDIIGFDLFHYDDDPDYVRGYRRDESGLLTIEDISIDDLDYILDRENNPDDWEIEALVGWPDEYVVWLNGNLGLALQD